MPWKSSSSIRESTGERSPTCPRSKRRACLRLALSIGALIWILAAVIFTVYLVREELNQPIAFLLLGADNRDEKNPARSDAIFILRTDPQQGVIRGLSLPRDLYVPIEGIPLKGKTDRINSALYWGDYFGSDTGLEAVRETISQLIRLPIKGSIIVRFNLVKEVVNSIGGVEVYIDKSVTDPNFHPIKGGGSYVLRFESGWNYLNGQRALEYIRMRKPDTDFGRMRRNRMLISAILSKIDRPRTWLALPRLVPPVIEHVSTDLPLMDLARLLWITCRHPSNTIQWYSIQRDAFSNQTTAKGARVMVADEAIIAEAAGALLGKPQVYAKLSTVKQP